MTFDYRERQTDRATYLIAGQVAMHTLPLVPPNNVRSGALPSWLSSTADLDFLDPSNPFFITDRALFSYGQFIGRSTPRGIFDRRPGVTILGDSGGFQLIEKPELWKGDATRAAALAWLQGHADEAMTLDIPTRAIGLNPLFKSFGDCLKTTLDNNAYFHAHACGRTRFLGVLQGTTRTEGLAWYDAVKAQPFDGGWAIGGDMRVQFIYLTELFTRMLADGMLGRRNRVHVLGTSKLKEAVMLSAIQKAISELPGQQDFRITFDTSNPSQTTKFGKLYGHPSITPDRVQAGEFAHRTYATPSHSDYSTADTRSLPIKSSRISEKLTIGDLCAAPAISRNSPWDRLAQGLVTHHNLDAMLRAFDEANSVMELPTQYSVKLAPVHVVQCYQALRTAFQHPDPVAHVKRKAKQFAML